MSETKLVILYLDDSEVQLGDVAAALTRQGHEVRTAATVSAALRMVNAADLVMIDFHMPGIDGTSALAMLRGSVRGDRPVVFYLYTSDRDVAISYKSLGFDGAFIEKGDVTTLPRQVEAANRMLQLKRLRFERQKT